MNDMDLLGREVQLWRNRAEAEARDAAALRAILRSSAQLLTRVEPELVPNHDAAEELAARFGLRRSAASHLVEDIREFLANAPVSQGETQ